VRMNERSLNTNYRQDANAVAELEGGHLACLVCEDALRAAHTTALNAVESTVLSGYSQSLKTGI
jgi:hypothetical protein